jgi:hypothetical protein
LQLDKGLNNGIDLSGELEQRFGEDGFQFDRTMFTLAGDYDLGKYLNLETGGRIFLKKFPEEPIRTLYRYHLDGTGQLQNSRVRLSLRSRFQYIFEGFSNLGDPDRSRLVSRQRFRADYHPFGTRVELAASLESWFLHGGEEGAEFRQVRYSGNFRYNLTFKSDFTFRYILEDEYNRKNPVRKHILLFGYAYRL